jgi:DNA-nicking Smr family endonuclease
MLVAGIHKEDPVEPVKVPIEDNLDLHTFRPRDIPDLLEDYLAECLKAGLYSVRIIHGKGKGVQKRRVQGLLQNNPLVSTFKDAPPEAGGWGATLVELKRNVGMDEL